MEEQSEGKEKISAKKEKNEHPSTSVLTHTGTVIDLLKGPGVGVKIEDIAHSLSNQCRFAGHSSRFYSIAEHSVYVALLAPKLFQIYYLLHDGHEYLYQDITRPLKNVIGGAGSVYDKLCDKCDLHIMNSLDLNYNKFVNLHDEIKDADNELLRIEQSILFYGSTSKELAEDHQLYGMPFGLTPNKARAQFMSLFSSLVN